MQNSGQLSQPQKCFAECKYAEALLHQMVAGVSFLGSCC